MLSRRGAAAALALGAAMLLAITASAVAMESCTGQYSATSLQPLPQPAIIGLDLHSSTPVNASLGQAFTRGMREAGVQVSGTPTARISVTWQAVGQGAGNPSGAGLGTGGGAGWQTWSGGARGGLQGGMSAALPDFPDARMFAPRQSARSALLMLRAEVRKVGSQSVAWVATVQCTVQSADSELLANQLGRLLGGAIGRRVSQGAV